MKRKARWIDLGSDGNWIDYGGKWGFLAPDGSWYVIAFANMYDACGEDSCKADGCAKYNVELKRLHLHDLSPKNVSDALRSCGWDSEDLIVSQQVREIAILEACISYGFGAPLESFNGGNANKLMADAKRYAMQCIADRSQLARQLARPVNKIGSTAEEYGRGDVDSAMHRGPFDTAKQIVRKMYGLPKDPT